MPVRLKLMPDYECYPLWFEGDAVGNVDPNQLPLSPETVADLLSWAEEYNGTLNREYPPESGFRTPEAEALFEVGGFGLWRRVRRELGNGYIVRYFSQLRTRLLEPAEDVDTEWTSPHRLCLGARLSLQRALLDAIPPSLRAVGVRTEVVTIYIVAYFDGEPAEDDREAIEVAVTEVMADFTEQVTILHEIGRCDAPARPPSAVHWVYFRKET